MTMRVLLLAALTAAGVLTACSDETKDKSKEAAASAAKDVKETAAAATDKAKEVASEAADKAAAAGEAVKEKAGEAADKAAAAGEAVKEKAGEAVDAAKAHIHEATAPAAAEKPAEAAPAESGK